MATNPEQTDPCGGNPSRGPVLSQTGSRTRRRFMGAAAGSVGVLLAVQARSALGSGICQSPSALVSGNASPRPDEERCSGGRSPGFWKQPQFFYEWTIAGAEYPTFSVELGECPTGVSDLSPDVILTPGTLVSEILPGAPSYLNGADPGIWEILAFPTNFGPIGQFMRHLIAAWLNAGLFADYPITRDQIVDMWLAAKDGGVYCPSSLTCTGDSGLDRDEIIAYISGMYDINAEIEKKICKAQSTSGSTGGGTVGGKGKKK